MVCLFEAGRTERTHRRALCGVQLQKQDQSLTTSQWTITMADISTFEQTYELADMLMEKATKEQLAECARLLGGKPMALQRESLRRLLRW